MFDWADFLALATEPAGRSGTNVPARGRAHLLDWEHFHTVPDRVRRRIADRGRRLRRRRDR